MWNKIWQKIIQINRATGIEVMCLQDAYFINTCSVVVRKNKPVKENKVQGIKSFDKLVPPRKNEPVSLVINGKGVLIKKLSSLKDSENPIAEVLPQANPSDFYYQVKKLENLIVFAAARKELVDKIIGEVSAGGFKVLNLSLGFSSILPFLSFIKNENTIETTSFILRMDSSKAIQDFEIKPSVGASHRDEYLVSDQYLQPYDLLGYTAAAELIAKGLLAAPEVLATKLVLYREEFKYFKLFRVAAVCALVGIFSILFINFFFYSHYYSENLRFSSTHTINEKKKTVNKELGSSLKSKERFLDQNGWTKRPKTSFFADRIASFMPEGIWLTTLQFYPLKEVSENEQLDFRKDIIQLNGICDDPTKITTLINNIKMLKDIKEVTMKSYSYNREENNGAFILEITTK